MKSEHAGRLTPLVSESDHSLGPRDAAVTLVEYGDYECPYCARAYPIISELRQQLADELRLVYRHFPQNSVHPHASVAAQAAEAAAAQGKFWEMHDLLFQHQDDLASADLLQYALKLGLEVYRFESDLSSERFAGKVNTDFQSGRQSGVTGTPALFINEVRYGGPVALEPLLAALREAGKQP